MIELSKERVEQILHEETVKKEEVNTILRGIYTRYMRLYERYYADTDALDDEKIAQMRDYHEETKSLLKYYYMDIPMDAAKALATYDDEYIAKLVGPEWKSYLTENFRKFRDERDGEDENPERLKAAFADHMLDGFYDAMDLALRDGFGTGSKAIDSAASGISDLLFGEDKK